ncbi:hypothetical protein ACFL2T_03555 [Elusimicrobiota bacterium]
MAVSMLDMIAVAFSFVGLIIGIVVSWALGFGALGAFIGGFVGFIGGLVLGHLLSFRIFDLLLPPDNGEETERTPPRE